MLLQYQVQTDPFVNMVISEYRTTFETKKTCSEKFWSFYCGNIEVHVI